MIEHDCNPAARQAGYPVGEEHDPDPPALEHGAGRDLTCQPYPGATATPRGLTGRALAGLNAEYRPANALALQALPGSSSQEPNPCLEGR